MEIALGRSFQILPHSTTSSLFPGKNINRSNTNWLVKKGLRLHRQRVVVRAQDRPTWLPGLDPPPYLDGTWVPLVQSHSKCFFSLPFVSFYYYILCFVMVFL